MECKGPNTYMWKANVPNIKYRVFFSNPDWLSLWRMSLLPIKSNVFLVGAISPIFLMGAISQIFLGKLVLQFWADTHFTSSNIVIESKLRSSNEIRWFCKKKTMLWNYPLITPIFSGVALHLQWMNRSGVGCSNHSHCIGSIHLATTPNQKLL